jgi:hypothetical protein
MRRQWTRFPRRLSGSIPARRGTSLGRRHRADGRIDGGLGDGRWRKMDRWPVLDDPILKAGEHDLSR